MYNHSALKEKADKTPCSILSAISRLRIPISSTGLRTFWASLILVKHMCRLNKTRDRPILLPFHMPKDDIILPVLKNFPENVFSDISSRTKIKWRCVMIEWSPSQAPYYWLYTSLLLVSNNRSSKQSSLGKKWVARAPFWVSDLFDLAVVIQSWPTGSTHLIWFLSYLHYPLMLTAVRILFALGGSAKIEARSRCSNMLTEEWGHIHRPVWKENESV